VIIAPRPPRFWPGAAKDEGDRPVATFVFLATLVFFVAVVVVLFLTADFAVAFFFSFFF
jgi:hypothetical protein